jgi:hypothetical protein
MVTPLTQHESTIRQVKEASASGKKGNLTSRRNRKNTGNGQIQISDGIEENAAVKNERSLSEEQQRAASPGDYEQIKKNARVCQDRR